MNSSANYVVSTETKKKKIVLFIKAQEPVKIQCSLSLVMLVSFFYTGIVDLKQPEISTDECLHQQKAGGDNEDTR